jgi:hypothetical protein
MGLMTVRKCDECEALKGEVNHWWAVTGSATVPTFATAAKADESDEPYRRDFCSHKCVGTAFHRWLDAGNIEKR